MSKRNNRPPTPEPVEEQPNQDESGRTAGPQDPTGLNATSAESSDARRHGRTAPPTGSGKPAINASGTPEVVPPEGRADDDAAENEAATMGHK